jgi:anti-anti-sigma regulatory factor
LYFNVEYVRDEFAGHLARCHDPVRTAVFFLGTVPQVDLAGADMLIDLRRHLAGRGIDLRLAGARSEVRHALVRAGLEPQAVEAYTDVDAALAY